MTEPLTIRLQTNDPRGKDARIFLNDGVTEIEITESVRSIRIEAGAGFGNMVSIDFIRMKIDAEVAALILAHSGEQMISVPDPRLLLPDDADPFEGIDPLPFDAPGDDVFEIAADQDDPGPNLWGPNSRTMP